MCPTSARAKPTSRSVMPPVFMRSPASTNSGSASSRNESIPPIMRWGTTISGRSPRSSDVDDARDADRERDRRVHGDEDGHGDDQRDHRRRRRDLDQPCRQHDRDAPRPATSATPSRRPGDAHARASARSCSASMMRAGDRDRREDVLERDAHRGRALRGHGRHQRRALPDEEAANTTMSARHRVAQHLAHARGQTDHEAVDAEVGGPARGHAGAEERGPDEEVAAELLAPGRRVVEHVAGEHLHAHQHRDGADEEPGGQLEQPPGRRRRRVARRGLDARAPRRRRRPRPTAPP